MRIVGGTLRGKKLASPDDQRIRPTSDRVRESLFNILANKSWTGEQSLPIGAYVIDAFAGTGALGIEALSRGAAAVRFIEHDRAAIRLIEKNLQRIGVDKGIVLARNAVHPGRASFQADLVLMDPPYKLGLAAPCLAALASENWLRPNAICVIELAKKEIFETPNDFREIDRRKYGNTMLVFVEWIGAEAN